MASHISNQHLGFRTQKTFVSTCLAAIAVLATLGVLRSLELLPCCLSHSF